MQLGPQALRVCRPCLIALLLLILFTAGIAVTWGWTSDTQLTTDLSADQYPSVLQAADDKLWVVWQSDRVRAGPGQFQLDLYYRIYNGTWSNDIRLTLDLRDDRLPAISQLINGTIMVFWVSNRRGNDEIFFKTTSNNGATWSSEVQFTNHAGRDVRPAVTQTKDLRIWVIWHSNRTGDTELYCRTSQDGVVWSSDTQLTFNSMEDAGPSIMQARDGTIWVAWASNRTGFNNNEIFYKTSSNNGVSWSTDTQLTTNPDHDVFPSIAQAKNRDIYLVWTANRDGGATPQTELYYRIYNGLAWTSDTRLTNDGNLDIGPSITQGKTDLWVFWTAGRPDVDNNQNIYYKTEHMDVFDVGIRDIWTFTPPLPIPINRTYQTRFVNITVEVINWSSVQESFTATLYYNDIFFSSQTVTNLGPGDSKILYFPWYTDANATGYYSWRATVTQVPGETYLTDNSVTLTPSFHLKVKADLDGDGLVDISDATLMCTNFTKSYTDYPDGDINGDAAINILDAVLIMINWTVPM